MTIDRVRLVHETKVNLGGPNTVMVMASDHLETWRIFPAGQRPDESVMQVSLYTPEPATTASARRELAAIV